MELSLDQVSIERLETYSFEVARGIGWLMPDLNQEYTANPIPEDFLKEIIGSPDRDQLIARLDGRIVGAATLNLIMGPGERKKGWLEGFVVSSDPSIRGEGVGYRLWQDIETWCREKSVPLYFTSHSDRIDARHFYLRQGAEIIDTNLFRVDARQQSD